VYRRDLAEIHHLAFGFHADACAPGILAALEPARGGVVLELGCGSGALTGHLRAAGHQVVATDASRYESPAPARFVRHITTFVAAGDDSWRRDDERHENVLVDTAGVPALLAAHGVEATVSAGFGDRPLPDGMVAVTGRRR
jgi:SAM-dependent methyltransferase